MKIAIVGYGKMGKMIEQAAKERNIEIASIIDRTSTQATHKEISKDSLKEADVCIDFTHPSVLVDNIKKYCELKKNVVVGTTGWYNNMEKVKSLVKNSGTGCIWSGNFSIGVNMFFKIIEAAAKVVDNVGGYDVMGVEYHHNKKADSPSGTMKMIGDILIDNIKIKKKAVYEVLDRPINKDEIHLASVRGGSIPGIHEIKIDSPADTITLSHSARTREGFALGAVMAAEFISNKKGFFGIESMMNEIIGGA